MLNFLNLGITKKIRLFFSLFLIFSTTSTLQAQAVQTGIKGGLNYATLGGDIEDANFMTSYHLGLFTNIRITEGYALQPEVLFSRQGAANYGDNYDLELKMDYLTIPVMAKFYLVDGFNLQFGPQVAFLLNAETEGDLEMGVQPIDAVGSAIINDENVPDVFKTADLGVNFALGYEAPLGLTLDARYSAGLVDVVVDKDYELNNQVIQLSLGYLF